MRDWYRSGSKVLYGCDDLGQGRAYFGVSEAACCQRKTVDGGATGSLLTGNHRVKTQSMLRTIRQTLTDLDIRLAILFGSQATGKTHAGSDADVSVALAGEMSQFAGVN